MKTIRTAIITLMAGSILFSCAPESKITSSWTSAEKTRSYHNVVVVAMTHDVNAKKIVEGDLASALRNKNIKVAESLDLFPAAWSGTTHKTEMLDKVRSAGADAIITVTLLNKQTQTHYVPGYPGYAPGFWGYYNYWYPTVYSPGYYARDRVYYIETNVYDVNTDELVWSGQSETYNPASLTGFSQELASLLVNRLKRDNIVTPFVAPRNHDKKVTTRL